MNIGESGRLAAELETFLAFKEQLRSSPGFQETETYGFLLKGSNGDRCDLLLTALTHGNEVIGLEILNLFLQKAVLHNTFSKFNIAFQLNNLEAYCHHRRLLESDLNRSFLSIERKTSEQKRALELEHLITRLRPALILDLHQTSEAAAGPFALVAEDPQMIRLAQNLTPEFPVITFPNEGFSSEGRTLTEFAREQRIPALVYEIGEKGFDADLAARFCDILLNLRPRELLENMKNTPETPQNTGYFHVRHRIPNAQGLKLVSGLRNLGPVRKGQILATGNEDNPEQIYECPEDSLVIFPRYRNIRAEEPDLALLAVKK